jgi:hypothetical protein
MITTRFFQSPRLRTRILNTLLQTAGPVDRDKGLAVRLLISAFLLASAIDSAAGGDAPPVRASAEAVPSGRIDVSRARPVHGGPVHRSPVHRSPVHRDAVQHGHAARSIEPVRNVGYLGESLGCDTAIYEPACGCETVCDCPVGQAYQQVYGPPACGIESSCGLEVSCGAEPWATETWVEPGCGAEGCATLGCDGCCDGLDPNCGCNVCRGGLAGFVDGLFPRLAIPWHRIELYAGVNGFTGPMNFANVSGAGTDRDGVGSFGFYQGYNKGLSLKFFGTDLAYQSGARFLQSNLSGAGFTEENRVQIFLTSGLYRRVDYGLQYGLVADYLYDDWYYRGDLMQLRGELSWVMRNSHVLGFKFASAVDDDTATTSVIDAAGGVVRNDIAFESITQYRLFYRQPLARRGMLEGFAGWTDQEDGLLGMELDLPIHGSLLWNTSATYLIPNEDESSGGHIQEGWNLMIGFTYRPAGLMSGSRYERPLLKVADNGTMIVDRK